MERHQLQPCDTFDQLDRRYVNADLKEIIGGPLPLPVTDSTTRKFQPPCSQVAKSKQSQVRLRVLLNSALYVAGSTVHGRLELIRPAVTLLPQDVRVGEVSAALCGYEDMNTTWLNKVQGSSEQRIFLRQSQCIRKAPAREVNDDSDGYRFVRKGKSYFPFSFHLPSDIPSAFTSSNVSIRYEITGILNLRINGKLQMLRSTVDFQLVQALDGSALNIYSGPIEVSDRTEIKNDVCKILSASASLGKTNFIAGTLIRLALRISNKTDKKLTMNRVSLMQDCHCVTMAKANLRTSKKVVSVSWTEAVEPGDDVSVVLPLTIPMSERTIINAQHISVTYRVQVGLGISSLDELKLELPIGLFHPLSLEFQTVSTCEERISPSNYYSVLPLEFRDQSPPMIPPREPTLPRLQNLSPDTAVASKPRRPRSNIRHRETISCDYVKAPTKSDLDRYTCAETIEKRPSILSRNSSLQNMIVDSLMNHPKFTACQASDKSAEQLTPSSTSFHESLTAADSAIPHLVLESNTTEQYTDIEESLSAEDSISNPFKTLSITSSKPENNQSLGGKYLDIDESIWDDVESLCSYSISVVEGLYS